jgi:hypothetical protein
MQDVEEDEYIDKSAIVPRPLPKDARGDQNAWDGTPLLRGPEEQKEKEDEEDGDLLEADESMRYTHLRAFSPCLSSSFNGLYPSQARCTYLPLWSCLPSLMLSRDSLCGLLPN